VGVCSKIHSLNIKLGQKFFILDGEFSSPTFDKGNTEKGCTDCELLRKVEKFKFQGLMIFVAGCIHIIHWVEHRLCPSDRKCWEGRWDGG
jgi:hypothetical protein